MTKLKTIKDLEKQDWSTHKGDMELVRAVFFEVKKEAINWIKNEKGYHNKFRDARADVLMEFFNLKEENLK